MLMFLFLRVHINVYPWDNAFDVRPAFKKDRLCLWALSGVSHWPLKGRLYMERKKFQLLLRILPVVHI